MTEPADLPTLLEISAEIAWPDTDAEAETRARLIAGGLGERVFGRLGDLAIWLSGVQGACPPQEPRRPRLVLFVEPSGTDDAGTDDTDTENAGATDANAATHLFADVAAIGVRIVEVAPGAGPTDPSSPDRLGAEAVDEAIRAGARAADDEIDAGADLLVAATSGGGGPSTDAVVSTMTLTEPVKVVGLDTAMSDAQWMTWVASVRDDRLRAMPHRHEVVELLAAVGTTQLAAITGFLLRAAARRTPVLLDGDVVAAATLLAREVTPNVVRWWQPGARSTSPAHALAMEEFGAVAVLDLELGLGAGVGGALAVPLLRAAARAVTELTEPVLAPPPETDLDTGTETDFDPDVNNDIDTADADTNTANANATDSNTADADDTGAADPEGRVDDDDGPPESHRGVATLAPSRRREARHPEGGSRFHIRRWDRRRGPGDPLGPCYDPAMIATQESGDTPECDR